MWLTAAKNPALCSQTHAISLGHIGSKRSDPEPSEKMRTGMKARLAIGTVLNRVATGCIRCGKRRVRRM